jgi:eukaryotic-like serine/threonine-protein kinase
MTARSSERAYPERVGRYQLLTPIAAGGMATVYLARVTAHGGFSREVAVKLLDTRDDSQEPGTVAETLLGEARLASRVRHPAVVPVLDVGESAAGPYLVMEYVEGESLANLLQATRKAGERLPKGIALRILGDALEGLQAAHEATDDNGRPLGIVHRDFSPQNILVGIDGATRLTDFGIARSVDRGEYTRTGVVRGKLGYMSPEQAQGLPLDRTTDIWSAGVVAWEIFAGKRLFAGEPVPTLVRILNQAPPALSTVLPDIPSGLSEVIAAALHHDVAQRMSSAGELRRRMLAACAGWAEPATNEEVADFVQTLAAVNLRELRERARRAKAISEPEANGSRAPRAPFGRWLLWGAVGSIIVATIVVAALLASDPSPVISPAASSAPSQVVQPQPASNTPVPVVHDPAPPSSTTGTPTLPSKPRARSAPAAKTPPAERKPNDLAPNPY